MSFPSLAISLHGKRNTLVGILVSVLIIIIIIIIIILILANFNYGSCPCALLASSGLGLFIGQTEAGVNY